MKRPWWWDRNDAAAAAMRFALGPAARAYALAGARRRARATPTRVAAHVICVGALSAGGSGKTPATAALAEAFRMGGRAVAIAARGHGGREAGPLKVDISRHDARAVGDEALMMAQAGDVYVGRRRDHAATLAASDGTEIVILDDGLTHPWIAPDRRLAVIASDERLVGADVIPAGPLREPLDQTLPSLDAAIIVGGEGPGRTFATARLGDDRVFSAHLAPVAAPPSGPILAFAGIGRPDRFFAMLAENGADLVGSIVFPDHHAYRAKDMDRLRRRAEAGGARLITTQKDFVKLRAYDPTDVAVYDVRMRFEDQDALLDRLGPDA